MENKEIIYFDSKLIESKIQVIRDGKTVWITQKNMSLMFGVTQQNISLHIQNVLDSKELDENSVHKFFLCTASDGKNYNTKHYNHSVIIAVGNRVNSLLASEFRAWVAEIFRQYTVDGIAINPNIANSPDLIEKAVDRLAELRVEESTLNKKVMDMISRAVDYHTNPELKKYFFAKVQNKIHYAVHGHTASELVVKRCDGTKDNAGMTVRKAKNVTISEAKNGKSYLDESEQKVTILLENIFLDYAKMRELRGKPIYMQGWIDFLDNLLLSNEFEVLEGTGTVSAEMCHNHVKNQIGILKERESKKERLLFN
jgi:hypothetical protein